MKCSTGRWRWIGWWHRLYNEWWENKETDPVEVVNFDEKLVSSDEVVMLMGQFRQLA